MSLLALLLLPAALIALLAIASPARALYGPPLAGVGAGAEIVSVDNSSDEQANAPTTDADISGNGLYVVFQTEATNLFEGDGESAKEQEENEPPGTVREGGIFRYDILTGQIQIVASGNLVVSEGPKEGEVLVRGAKNPSVSEDGQYVAFSSGQPLVAQAAERAASAGHNSIDVYVRDMSSPHPVEEGGYTLVSALNHSEEPPEYDDSGIGTIAGGEPGTQVWPNTAISANGRYVLFRAVEVPSNLPEGGEAKTVPGQLFVRDLQEETTTLVTQTPMGAPAGGALGPSTLSADGTTVAWVGENAEKQTIFLPGEPQNASTPYYLWRRWQEPETKTRRVTGFVDPEDPECREGESVIQSPTAEGPCYGPLSYQESSLASISAQAPGLSADGYTVAFLAGSLLRPDETKPDALDVFTTDMRSQARKDATSELTLAVKNAQGDGGASITSLAFSSDGMHIAFVSQRNVFLLPEPALLGSLSEAAAEAELYVIDLSTDTLERAILGQGDAEPNGSAENNPTLSANGSRIAFVSAASDLIGGDANGVPDAFLAEYEQPLGTEPPSVTVNEPSMGFSLESESTPELTVQVKRGRRSGEDLLTVKAPASGKIMVRAIGPVAAKSAARGNRRGAKRASRRRPVTLASAQGKVGAGKPAKLVLRVDSKYSQALRRTGTLQAVALVDFKPAAAGEALKDEVELAFHVVAKAKRDAQEKPHGRH
ncbi:MAG TPA: hypothetical protein VGF95_04720 [Solirubrobacteraceae bacterium]